MTRVSSYAEIIKRQERSISMAEAAIEPSCIIRGGKTIMCLPKVSPPHTDSWLLADTIDVTKDEVVLDAFCGTGVVTVLVAPKAKRVIATDINNHAVANTRLNIKANKIGRNAKAVHSNIFPTDNVVFDVIALNPPYTNHKATTVVERAVWDEDHATLRAFFSNVHRHLNREGRIYLSWADFADFSFVRELAVESGFRVKEKAKAQESLSDFMNIENMQNDCSDIIFYQVFELRQTRLKSR